MYINCTYNSCIIRQVYIPKERIVHMFINICWTKDGETKKTLMAMDKAVQMVQELENQGIKTWLQTETEKITV